MNTEPYIFLAGASRGVGKEIAKCLSIQNKRVKALLRTETARPELEAIGVEVAIGDALNPGEIEEVISSGEQPIQVVISTIGGVPNNPQRPDYIGNKNLIDAAVKMRVEKFILVSSIGAGDSIVALNPQALENLKEVLKEKEKAEQYLVNSGLTYTIIRPGGLQSEVTTGNGILTTNPTVAGMINRADVAQLVCQCLHSDAAKNKILSAVDKNMLFGQPEFVEYSLS